MSGQTLVFATHNPGKLRELRQLLRLPGLEVLSLDAFPGAPDVVEDGETFSDNACKKALEIMAFTGLPSLADDSGLEVDALDGAPGVYSARYAGEGAGDRQRIQLLLGNLEGVPPERRTARFRCVMALADPKSPADLVLSEGTCEGRILDSPLGEGGFGYDPVFLVPHLGLTFAQLPAAQKNRISHRGLAMARMVPEILRRFGPKDRG